MPADAEQAAGEILGWQDLGTYGLSGMGSFCFVMTYVCVEVAVHVCVCEYFVLSARSPLPHTPLNAINP